MIVDCHTYVWQSPEQLGQLVLGDPTRAVRPRGLRLNLGSDRALFRNSPPADAEYHWQQSAQVDRTIVLGFKSRYLRAEIPNRYVADYVRRYPQKLIGFAGIDPSESTAAEDIRIARRELNLRGIVLSPANQDLHPCDTRMMKVYEQAEELEMPVLFHPGSPFTEQSKMEYGRPYLIDEVARSFPKLRMIVAQLGQPFIDEALCLLCKHVNVFADVSGLLRRPWQAYNALVSAYHYGVIDKLLFGSDFPYTSATECIESLYSINQMAHGTNLPIVPRESLRGIVERDTLGLLGID